MTTNSTQDAADRTSAELPKDDPELFPIVGIGASAGGLDAYTQLLKALPADTGMGFVLVQHLDPEHESSLTQILGRATSLPVVEIEDGQPVRPNHVHVIPPGMGLEIAEGRLQLQERPQSRQPFHPIDTFFESLAIDLCERAVGVVLSGTATDGTLGLEAIKGEGGFTFAQDDSAAYESMPRSAVAAGCVDQVAAPAQIAAELARLAMHPYLADGQEDSPFVLAGREAASATAHEDDDTPLPPGRHRPARTGGEQVRDEAERDRAAGDGPREKSYKKILLLLRNHSGVDFSLYRSTTIQRRIARRVVINKQDALEDYVRFLRGNTEELDTLYSDVLISVTSFFRNPEAFEALQREVLPKLLDRQGDEPVRVWVLGCSTGQEAYSIAMSFVESMDRAPRMSKLQIFATDLNDKLLEKARAGLYAKSLAQDISPERLRRFFIEEGGGYRINKMLREMVVFARQNLISDPPFSRMDLVSCRNLLIYLDPSLQKKALPTFHYALKPGGFLLLGASESVGNFTDLFKVVDKKRKLFSKKPAATPPFHLPVQKAPAVPGTPPVPSGPPSPEVGALRGELNAQREADRLVANQFAPPAVLINEDSHILQFRGPTGAFLEPPSGKATFDVLKMAREGLVLPLRAAINEARTQNKNARRENVRVNRNGHTRTITVQVIPLKNLRERCFLVVFEEAEARGASRKPAQIPAPARTKTEEASRIAELETELSETREYLQSLLEQQEAANEELQAANEEVQSGNEELQSINEELETSKEELESANEELTTVNEEMGNRNTELHLLNNDLVNLQRSIQHAILLLGRDLRIRRFSQQAAKQFDLLATDVGRPIGHLRHDLIVMEDGEGEEDSRGDGETEYPPLRELPLDLESLAAETIAEVRERECEVRQRDGRWFLLRARPYMTLDNKIDGAVLVLVDVDALKRTQMAATQLAEIVASSDDAIISKDLNGIIQSWNAGAERLFGYTAAEAIGRSITMIIPPDRPDEEPEILARLRRGESIDHYQSVRQRKDGTLLDISLTISPTRDTAGRIIGASKIARDITQRKRYEDELLRFNNVAVGRELRMIELKQEINELCRERGEAERYSLEFDEGDDEDG